MPRHGPWSPAAPRTFLPPAPRSIAPPAPPPPDPPGSPPASDCSGPARSAHRRRPAELYVSSACPQAAWSASVARCRTTLHCCRAILLRRKMTSLPRGLIQPAAKCCPVERISVSPGSIRRPANKKTHRIEAMPLTVRRSCALFREFAGWPCDTVYPQRRVKTLVVPPSLSTGTRIPRNGRIFKPAPITAQYQTTYLDNLGDQALDNACFPWYNIDVSKNVYLIGGGE